MFEANPLIDFSIV